MNRRRADVVVGALVGAVLVLGGVLVWQASGRRSGHMMDSMMGSTTTGTDPLWFALGTLLVAALVGGAYLTVRDDLVGHDRPEAAPEGPAPGTAEASEDSTPGTAERTGEPTAEVGPAGRPPRRVLDLLPDDERRVLEPVLDSPGLTQIELRDRSDFSKSKVSQTVSELEKRGLVSREPQGRTYRIYPGDELAEDDS